MLKTITIACVLLVIGIFAPNVNAGSSENLLQRTLFLEKQVELLIDMYNDILQCKDEECLLRCKKEYAGKIEWDNVNFGTLNIIKDIKVDLLGRVINSYEMQLEENPDNTSLRDKVHNYRKEYEELIQSR